MLPPRLGSGGRIVSPPQLGDELSVDNLLGDSVERLPAERVARLRNGQEADQPPAGRDAERVLDAPRQTGGVAGVRVRAAELGLRGDAEDVGRVEGALVDEQGGVAEGAGDGGFGALVEV